MDGVLVAHRSGVEAAILPLRCMVTADRRRLRVIDRRVDVVGAGHIEVLDAVGRSRWTAGEEDDQTQKDEPGNTADHEPTHRRGLPGRRHVTPARDGSAVSTHSLSLCSCVVARFGHLARSIQALWRAMIRLSPPKQRGIAMPWTKRLIAGFTSALSAVVVLSACQFGYDPNAIKVFSSMPRTGATKGLTDAVTNGIKMAFDEAGNKVGTYNIRYEDLDDATAAKGNWDAGKEADNANRAANDAQVMAYIGTFNSGAAAVAIPILCKANLVMISPANSYPGLTKPGKGEADEPDKFYQGCKRNYVRVIPADDLQGVAGANWARQAGISRVYVLNDTELYGHGVATVFADHARTIGLQVVGGPDGIDPKASDYRALAERIRGTNPELVYFGGVTANNAG